MHLSNKLRFYSYGMLLAVFIVMMFFGIRSKSIQLSKNFTFLPEQNAAQFAYPSMVVDPSLLIPPREEGDKLNLHMVILPEDAKVARLKLLMQIRADKPDDDFVIAQWKSSLIIMNGNDFSNVKRQPKIYTEIPNTKKPILVSIVSDNKGTWVYFNGQMTSHSEDLVLKLPEHYSNSLILGNSDKGHHAWVGRMYGINIYYSPDERASSVLLHYQEWKTKGDLPVLSGNKVITNLNFTPEQTENMELLEETPFSERNVLDWPTNQISVLGFTFIIDIVVNFIGFMPFGFLLMLVISTKIPVAYRLVFVSFISFSFSLFIEISQIWIPLRHSSSLDLLLNSSGGLAGALCCVVLLTKYDKIRSVFKLLIK